MSRKLSPDRKMKLAQAKALIERTKTARPECDECTVIPYDDQRQFTDGFEPCVDRAGFIRRCATCAATRKYPWAWRLDAERVASFLRKNRHMFHVSELEALL